MDGGISPHLQPVLITKIHGRWKGKIAAWQGWVVRVKENESEYA